MYTIVDNFLSDDEFNTINNLFGLEPHSDTNIPLYYSGEVAEHGEELSYWNYYFFHTFYEDNKPQSNLFDIIYNIFIPKFEPIHISESATNNPPAETSCTDSILSLIHI